MNRATPHHARPRLTTARPGLSRPGRPGLSPGRPRYTAPSSAAPKDTSKRSHQMVTLE